MSALQTHIDPDTPMGAALRAGGATFRVWAPRAEHVYVVLHPKGEYQPTAADELVKNEENGHWTGFVEDVVSGTPYLFYMVGSSGAAFRRDPCARELDSSGQDVVCVVREHDGYPWHDGGFRPPDFADLSVYQFHVGVFSARDRWGNDVRHRVGKLLDALERVNYLAELGVRAVQPLPVVEFHTPWSLGYNGSDLYSPEFDYCVGTEYLEPYVERVNGLLAAKGCAPLSVEQLTGHANQLKAFVDVFHLYGIAVIFDVVYSHAGYENNGLWLFDQPGSVDLTHNAYFGPHDWTGPVFRYTDRNVAAFLIQNAVMFLTDFHADGLRFDEVSVIARFGGWSFAQDLTETLRWVKPSALLLAEYWEDDRGAALRSVPSGMGFDAGYADRLRGGVRTALAQAASGAGADVDMGALGESLRPPWAGFALWRAYNYIENHDLLLDGDGDHRQPRVVTLAGGRASGWFARSRSRVATGLLLTAPGIPALFMGEEFLEDKWWSDSPERSDRFIWWDGAEGLDPDMGRFLDCTRGLLRLRNRLPGLRSDGMNVFHANSADRILAFHRWVPGAGHDVVIVASLREEPFEFGSYRIGFPRPGRWREAFNTDAYEDGSTQGNAGSVVAEGPPLHALPASAGITIPANGLLVFTHT